MSDAQNIAIGNASDSTTADLRLQFALAVAKPGSLALLIDSNNKMTSREPIERAAKLGVCYAVEVDDDVLALDADKADAAKDLESTILPMLEKLDCGAVVVASGGKGRRHLFARIADATLRDGIAAASRCLGCDVRKTIRPPLAPHRNAFPVGILHPSNFSDALRRLLKREESKPKATEYRRKSRLSARMFELLRNGDASDRYRSRSEIVQAVALAAVNAGLSEELVWKILSNPTHRAGQKVQQIQREKGAAAARRYVARSYKKAVAHAAKNPPIGCRNDALNTINDFERAADAYENQQYFAGRIGSIDRAVYQALIDTARRCGSIAFDASLRQLSESAGISSLKTIRTSVHRLKQARIVEVLKRPNREAISRYRLRSSPTHYNLMGGCEEIGTPTFASPCAEIWWNRKSAWRLWRMIEGQTSSEIARRVNISRRAAQQHLRNLLNWGLAQRDKRGRFHRIADAASLQRAAERRGVAGKAAALRSRHLNERELWGVSRGVRRTSGRVELVPDEIQHRNREEKPVPSPSGQSVPTEMDPELARAAALVRQTFPGARLVEVRNPQLSNPSPFPHAGNLEDKSCENKSRA